MVTHIRFRMDCITFETLKTWHFKLTGGTRVYTIQKNIQPYAVLWELFESTCAINVCYQLMILPLFHPLFIPKILNWINEQGSEASFQD